MASGEWLSGLTSGLSITRLIRALTAPDAELSAADSASTLFRFFRSRHVIDLRLIVAATSFLAVAHFVLVFIFGIFEDSSPGVVKWISGFTKFFVSYTVPAIPIYGGVIAWAYLAASTRLGTVDLFAAEISTLCRVGSVFDVGKRCVEQYDTVVPEVSGTADRLTQNSSPFVSEEDYFPVFTGNSRDLQALESSVVTHITAFYTFMKATRDSQRKLAQIIPPHSPGASLEGHPWHTAISDIIYMLFLGYESGRRAVHDLVEFEPVAAENKLMILLTELKCYSFLVKCFEHDQLRHARLKLRVPIYKKEMHELCDKVRRGYRRNEKDWTEAINTLPEIERLYKETFGEELNVAATS